MDFLIVADVFSKYILVRKLPNSTSAAMCIELSMIVTELGLPQIIRSDNGPCYNSKEFQQFPLQCYSITHQTSSPNHPRSNGFIERMVGVAKKLMDKAGKEGKPWISSLTTGSHPVRQHCITIAIDDTVHTQVCTTWCPRNASNSPGAHQKAREQG